MSSSRANNLGIDFEGDLQGAINDLPTTMTLPNGDQINVAQTVLQSRDVPQWGGTEGEYRQSFVAVARCLDDLEPGDLVTVGGRTWRVLGLHRDGANAGTRIDVGERYARE